MCGDHIRGKEGRAQQKGCKLPFKSAPAQNARPSPVTMPTRSEGSLSSHVHISCSSWFPAELMQLRDLGRENVTRRMNGAGKLSFAKEVAGGGLWNLEVDIMDCQLQRDL